MAGSFIGTTPVAGVQQATVSGYPWHLQFVLDDRMAVLEDTVVHLPSGIFGHILGNILRKTKDEELGWNAALLLELTDCLTAAHIATAFANVDMRKIDSEDRLIAYALAAGLKGIDTDVARRVHTKLMLAQLGTNLAPTWEDELLSTLMAEEGDGAQAPILRSAILKSMTLANVGSLEDDLKSFERLAGVKVFLSLLTRLPRIVSQYASSASGSDMEQRANVLRRLAALLATMVVQPQLARLGVYLSLFQSPLFEAHISVNGVTNQLTALINRVKDYLKWDVFGWLEVCMAAHGPRADEHLGRKVTAFTMPLGCFRQLTDKARMGAQFTAVPSQSHLGDQMDTAPIDANTVVHPVLRDVGGVAEDVWVHQIATLYADVRNGIDSTLRTLDAMTDVNFALRVTAGGTPAAEIAKTALMPAGSLAGMVVPPPLTSKPDQLIPVVTAIRTADAQLSTAGSITRSLLLPQSFDHVADIRDWARFQKIRATGLTALADSAADAAQDLISNEVTGCKRTGVTLASVSFPLQLSPIYANWPTRSVPLPFWEFTAGAFLGGVQNGPVRPPTIEGFCDLLGVSPAQLQEVMDIAVQAGSSSELALAIACSLGRIGLITHHATEKEGLQALRDPQAPNSHLNFVFVDEAVKYVTYGSEHVQRHMLFGAFAKPIQLTSDGTYLLWPYSAVPMPGDILAENMAIGEVVLPNGTVAHPNQPAIRVPKPTGALWRNDSIARTANVDARSYALIALPAGRKFGAALVISLLLQDLGYRRFVPARVDIIDALLDTIEDAPSGVTPILLSGRPGATTSTRPPNTHLRSSGYKAEMGREL
jgi:hypothetical protein